jgi:outer membrane protein
MALSAELLVFNGLNNLYNKQASQIALDRSNLALLQQKLLLGIDITLLFHKVSLTNLNVSILEVTNSNTNEEIEKMEEQITAGSVAKSNIYELKAQAKKEALEILGLQNEIEKYINNLSKLLNWKEESRLQLEADGLSYIDDSVLIYKVLFVKNGIIDKSVITFVAEKEKDLANKAVQLQKSHAYPGISANASFSSRYLKDAFDPVSGENNYTYINQLDNNQYRQVALTLRIPVFNRYQNTTEIKLLKIDYENKKLQLEGVKKQLSVELDNIQTDIMYCARKIQETEELVDAYKKSFEAASEKYHSGLLDSYTLNTSKNNFTGSMLQLNKLKVELSMNIELLKLYYKFTL